MTDNTWIELCVDAPQEYVEPLSQIFFRYGHGGVVLEEAGGYNPDEGETPSPDEWVRVKTYLPVNKTTKERRHRIDLGVRLVAHVSPISELYEREINEDEWATSWKEHFHVLHVGKNLVVAPTWREYEPKPDDIIIGLDPGMAFGTGHHPTTRMCLEHIERSVSPGMDVLDVGCGSGILSIAAAKMGCRSVLGIEIDSVAVKVAKENIRDNGVEHAVRILEGTLPSPDAREGVYDIVVANISAKVITEFADSIVRSLKPGGKIIASGILIENRSNPIDALTAEGIVVERTMVEGDWIAMLGTLP